MAETYLGDGVYASFDGYQIKLRAPRPDGDHEVYLEPQVFDALSTYRKLTLVARDRAAVEKLMDDGVR